MFLGAVRMADGQVFFARLAGWTTGRLPRILAQAGGPAC